MRKIEREMEDHMKRSCETSSGVTEDAIPMQLNCSENRKLEGKLEDECRGEVELLNAVSPAESGTSGCYEGDEPTRAGRRPLESPDLKNVDWQPEGFGTEISTSVDGTFREETPTSELCGDSEQVMLMESSSVSKEKPTQPAPASLPTETSTSAPKTPSAAELEDFFVAAEKYVQERFSEKYNYDVVKDVPLEGRYEWVRLHP